LIEFLAGFFEENFGLWIGESVQAVGLPVHTQFALKVSFSFNNLFISQCIYFILTHNVA